MALAAAATLTWIVDIATRPPCPDRYVRLVDLELAMPVVSAAVTLGSIAMIAVANRSSRGAAVLSIGVAVIALSATMMFLAIGALAGEQTLLADSCWTF